MRLFWNSEIKRRAKLFRGIVLNLVLSGQDEKYPSCEQILMGEIDQAINNSEKELASFEPDHDYEKNALDVIYNTTFEMVTSGCYHFYAGMLKPVGMQLRHICVFCLRKALENGTISQQQYDEQILALSNGVKYIG